MSRITLCWEFRGDVSNLELPCADEYITQYRVITTSRTISRVINASYCKLDSKYKVTTMDRDTETRGNKHKHILRHVTTQIKMTNQSW